MTLMHGNRVSLSAGDWIKVLTFLAVQTAALVGVGIDMRERLVVVETRLSARDDNLRELRTQLSEVRNEIAELRRSGK
jgi:hypothetical protein